MALTADQLRDAMRLGSTAAETAAVTRLQAVAQALVTERAPDAPDAIADEAVVRLSAFLYDRPHARMGDGMATAWRNSGAGDLVLPWLEPRAVSTDAE